MSNPNEYTAADLAEYEAELTDIAGDPNLTTEEKLDAINTAVNDEINDIVNSSSTSAATTPATEETTVTDPATTEPTPQTTATATGGPEQTAAAGHTSATADVVGDPAAASYSTTTTTSTATTSATSTETTEVQAGAAPTDPAPATVSGVNASIGVNGTVDYFSPRDVDGDGNVDVIHSRVDGVDTITHIDDDGNITLVEQDTDHNGTYETAAAPRADGTIRVAEDLDDDGTVDLATYLDPTTGQPVRQDEIHGARITDSQFDTDGDGQPDVHLIDTDGDGRFDTVAVDTDGDGIVNATLIDTDGDGRFDLITSDNDNDGIQESYLTSNDNGAGSLGNIDTYESLIPADDSYHTQAAAEPHEPPAAHDLHTDIV